MNKKIIFRILISFLTIGCISTSVWSGDEIKYSGVQGNYILDRDFDDTRSVSSRGMSDVVKRSAALRASPAAAIAEEEWDNYDDSISTVDYDSLPPSLLDSPDIKKYIKRLFLEITPNNYVELNNHANNFIEKVMFNRFDEGACVKWKGSLGFDENVLFPLLSSLKSIKRFKVSVDWDTSDTNFSDLIADSVQGFKFLEELDLSGCDLTDEEMRVVIESTSGRQLTKLNVTSNRITSDIFPDIRERFEKLKHLKSDVKEGVIISSISPHLEKEGVPKSAAIPADIFNGFDAFPERYTDKTSIFSDPFSGFDAFSERTASLHQPTASDKKKVDRAAEAKAEADRIIADAEEESEYNRTISEAKIKADKIKTESQAKILADAKVISDRAAAGGGIVTTSAHISSLKLTSSPRVTIPDFARGYEDIYRRFIGGKLLYKPDQNSTRGQIEIPFTSLLNPLEGTFDLSHCGDVGRYISISTGYRKGKIAANKDKLEIWITPKFVVENELRTSASHYAPIMTPGLWTSPVGIIWTYGGWDDMSWYDYLTTKQFDEISAKNLYDSWYAACVSPPHDAVRRSYVRPPWRAGYCGGGPFYIRF